VWTLTTLNGKKVIAEKPPTMKFANGKLAIFGGVNRLTGSYGLVDQVFQAVIASVAVIVVGRRDIRNNVLRDLGLL
jgi:heat shock protein HslJ